MLGSINWGVWNRTHCCYLENFSAFCPLICSPQSHSCNVIKRIPYSMNELDLNAKFLLQFLNSLKSFSVVIKIPEAWVFLLKFHDITCFSNKSTREMSHILNYCCGRNTSLCRAVHGQSPVTPAFSLFLLGN